MNDLYDASAPGQATELGSQQWDTSASPPATLALARDAQRQLTNLARQADSARDQVLQIFRAIDEHRQAGVPTTFDVATELEDTSDKLLDLMGRIHDACDPYVAWCPADDSPDPEEAGGVFMIEVDSESGESHFGWVNHANEARIGVDGGEIIIAWNDAAERLFGWSSAEAVGQPFTLIVPDEAHDEFRTRVSRVYGGNPEQFVTRHQHRDGSLIDVEVTPSAVFTSAGEVVGAMGTYRPLRSAADRD